MNGLYSGWIRRARLALVMLVAALAAARADAQLPSTGTALDVRVTRDGQPVAGAVVCIGTSARPVGVRRPGVPRRDRLAQDAHRRVQVLFAYDRSTGTRDLLASRLHRKPLRPCG